MRGASYPSQTGVVTGADYGCSMLGLFGLELTAAGCDFSTGGVVVLTRAIGLGGTVPAA